MLYEIEILHSDRHDDFGVFADRHAELLVNKVIGAPSYRRFGSAYRFPTEVVDHAVMVARDALYADDDREVVGVTISMFSPLRVGYNTPQTPWASSTVLSQFLEAKAATYAPGRNARLARI